MSGWIKLHRKLTEKGFYSKDSEKVHLWIHLLMKANRAPREELLGGVPIRCESGQFTCGRKQLSIETGICESKIERILTYFEKIEQQIEQQKTSKNRLISIVAWNDYQQSEQQIEQQLNNDRTTTEQQLNTLQEEKECKEIKEVKELETWRTDFLTYKRNLSDAYLEIVTDKDYLIEMQKIFPKLNIIESIKKSIMVFWATEEGWKNKKAKKSKDLDWKQTFRKTIELNKVYL